MKIHARRALVALAAALLAGCGTSVTGPADAATRPASPVADQVDNPGQTPMKP